MFYKQKFIKKGVILCKRGKSINLFCLIFYKENETKLYKNIS